ncbi:hypothetical protein SGUI_0307 [Serinicoccus hydrothermalis]|uniref:Uncharacterized protein n=1 Tax=Serinicoccus hydrothermalis TaxID=1758689 RepID=A0A1B1N8E8_9MICO|nr:hypothetical protein [Serinicoccus hydrothermalis]ANS77703.1 hypothetical protein SGUI_0307 [Serinicoccus hydrothermalis]
MGITETFYERVGWAAEGSGYEVLRTEEGFDVRRNVVDARWVAMLHQAQVREVIVHHVAVDEPSNSYTISDDVYGLEWQAGVDGTPQAVLSFQASRTRGTVKSVGFRKEWAFMPDGGLEKVVDYTYNTEDGRRLITGPARELGLRRQMDTWTKVGLIVGAIGAAGGLLALVLVLVFVL